MDRIEFYKNRTLGERFSASIDFLKQNWKVLYKNILIGSLPLAILVGYFLQYYQQASLSNLYTGGSVVPNPLFLGLYFVALIVLIIYLNAMTSAVMIKYYKGTLTPSTGWGDLCGTMFSISGKIFLVGVIIWGVFLAVIAVIAAIISMFVSGITAGEELAIIGITILFLVFILLGFLLAFGPSISLSCYPAIFSGVSIGKSIKIAFGMGFRNWGNVVITLLLSSIVIGIVSAIFTIPNTIVALFAGGQTSILTFIFAFIAVLGNVLTYPVMFILVAFQYFTIVESEQGVSLQSKVDEFENL